MFLRKISYTVAILLIYINIGSTQVLGSAITDNQVEVLLKDDSTWVTVDSVVGEISPFATTEDSQMVYLKEDGTWEYMDNEGAVIDSILKLHTFWRNVNQNFPR